MNDFYLDNKVSEGTILAFLGEWGSGMLSNMGTASDWSKPMPYMDVAVV